ncbi:TonB-dependent receptor [Aureibaculum sp. A20]|uniref:TonB-dependent receptor n=1 Tax=Aureibaculum flavum TaxID=2795986 RepID=A0ABS0WVQ6_9FLAO|nr:TonB-dependent receptor [Aureibaculum flavum]MBJ2176064.1 TonB-dependent receptor [Aureibaculum flavum]
MKNQLIYILCFFLYSAGTFAQQAITVTGEVVDAETGLTIPGANIIEKGTKNGVMSDFDGKFTIQTKNNATLLFSFIGYATQEVQVNGQTNLNVVLQVESSLLDEVVVVGYGTVKKSDLTGSVTRANIENFTQQPNTSIVQSLQGAVTGLNVGAVTGAGGQPSISIRGRNSLSGSTNPLIVLDGIIYRGSLIDINPSDVASVDVLRDASSKAIYGSQAANGVVIITTKTGKKAKKPSFNFSTYYASSTPTNRLHPLDREGYIQKAKDMFWEDAYNAPDYTTPNTTFDPSTTWAGQSQIIDGYNEGTDTDWMDLVTQTPFIYNANINMSGNSEKTAYFLSAGYTEEDGWAKNDTYDRINLRANFDTQVTSWLNIGMQTFMSSGDYSGAAANIRNAMILSPLVKPYNEDGTINYYPVGNDPNPLASLETDNFDKRLNLFGNFSATVAIPYVKGLTYKLSYSTNYRTQRYSNFNPNGQNFTGSASKSNSMTQDETLDNVLTYVKTINDKHNINVTLLYGYEGREGEDTNASSSEFLNQALGYNSLEAGNIENQRVSSGAWDETSLYQMGRLSYKFDDKYLATFTVRRDGFSGFGTNKKFGTFPSVALGWVLSKEKFVSDLLPSANLLKLRASYGASGNRTLGRYGTLASVGGSYQYVYGDGGSAQYGQSISSLANNDLGWETTTGLNVGLDFGFLNNRINGYVEYYSSKTEDLLFNINIPRITGFGSIRSNIGEVANQGIEFSLNTVNVKNDDFEWNSSFIFSKNKNEVVTILGRDDDGDGKEDDLISNGIFIGESIGTIYHYVVDGKYQIGDTDIPSGYNPGNYRLKDLDGVEGISGDDREIIGSTEPAYRFSIFNEFKYKNWSLSAFINSIQGGKNGYLGNNNAKKSEYGWQAHTMATFNTVKEFDYWTPSNPNGEYSGLNYLDPIDPNIYKDRSFVRLQDVSLAYNVPKSVLGKWSIDNLKLFVSGKNLHTWTKWGGIDPETGAGYSPGSYPVMRSYTIGLNLTF